MQELCVCVFEIQPCFWSGGVVPSAARRDRHCYLPPAPYARGMVRYFVFVLMVIGAGSLFGQDQTPSKPKQFICVLRLVSRLYDEHAWSKEDDDAFDQHFSRLKEATDRGQVICVGRTAEPLDKTFGIVVFEAKDQEAAADFMNNDPTVVAGLVTMELHPFTLACERKTP